MEVGQLWLQLGIDPAPMQSGLASAKAEAETFGTRLGSIFKEAGAMAVGYLSFEAITEGIKEGIGGLVEFQATLEQTRVGMETLMGSTQQADAYLRKLQDYSAATPFRFADLADLSKQLLAAGFNAQQLLPTINAISNAASGLGAGSFGMSRIVLALGDMQRLGKVDGAYMRDLARDGIPAWNYLAQAMGKSTAEVQKMVHQGMIPAGAAIQAILAGMDKQFPDMVKKQGQTFNGLVSTIKDDAALSFAYMDKELFQKLKAGLQDVKTFADRIYMEFASGKSIGQVFRDLVPPDLATKIMAIFNAIRNGWNDLGSVLQAAKPVVADIGQTLLTAFSIALPALELVWHESTEFAKFVLQSWPEIKPVVMTVVAAYLAMNAAQTVLRGVREAQLAFQGALVGGQGVMGLVSRLVGQYRLELALLTGGAGQAATIGQRLSSVFAAVGKTFLAVQWEVVAVAAVIAVLVAAAVEVIRHWSDARAAFKEILAGILVAFQEVRVGIADWLNFVYGGIARFLSGIMAAMSAIPGIGGAFKLVKEGLDAASGAMEGFAASSRAALSESKAHLGDTAGAIGKFAGDVGGDMASMFTTVKDKVTGAFGGMKAGANDTSAAIFNGLGIGSPAADAMEQVSTKGNKAASAWKTAADSIRNAIAQVQQEVSRELDSLDSAVIDALKNKYTQARDLANKEADAQISAAQKASSAIIREIDRRRQAQIDALDTQASAQEQALQAQIDAIDAKQAAADRAQQNQEESDRVAALQAQLAAVGQTKTEEQQIMERDTANKIALLKQQEMHAKTSIERQRIENELTKVMDEQAKQRLATDAENAKQRESIQQQLDAELDKQQKELLKEQDDDRKSALRKEIEAIRKQTDAKKVEIERDATAQKDAETAKTQAVVDNLKQQKADVDKFYADRLQTASIEQEAERMLMSKNQQSVIDLLQTYGKGWHDLGKTFGQRMMEGLGPYLDQMKAMVASVMGMVGGGGGVGDLTNPQNQAIIAAKEEYAKAAAVGDTKGMALAHQAAEDARRSGGTIGENVSLNDITKMGLNLSGGAGNVGGIPALANGGMVTQPTLALVGERGPEVITPLSQLQGGGGRPQTIIVQIDGRPILRALLPYMPGELARVGVRP